MTPAEKEWQDEQKELARTDVIQAAVLAALGCTVINYKSPRKLDEAARQIARFVEAALGDARL